MSNPDMAAILFDDTYDALDTAGITIIQLCADDTRLVCNDTHRDMIRVTDTDSDHIDSGYLRKADGDAPFELVTDTETIPVTSLTLPDSTNAN